MWHGCQWGIGLFEPEDRKNINILVSPSNDGEIIARICHLLGFKLIRGSLKREGDKAAREIITTTQNGENVAFFVDGPKGPNHVVKKGLIRLAKMAKVPIIPAIAHTDKKRSFNSWDNYEVPNTLYLNGVLALGEPIIVPEDISKDEEEEYRLKVEKALFDIHNVAIEEYNKIYGRKKNG